jgi:hypothetical protein
MPPAPIATMISYGPRRVPGAKAMRDMGYEIDSGSESILSALITAEARSADNLASRGRNPVLPVRRLAT